MAKTVQDHLIGALENLQADDLKKFKAKLNEISVKKGYENIPRGLLEKADVLDIVSRLINYYAEDYAVRLTIKVLGRINCKGQAEKLWKDTKTGSVQTPVRPTSATSRRNGSTSKAPKPTEPLASPLVSPRSTSSPAMGQSSVESSASKATESSASKPTNVVVNINLNRSEAMLTLKMNC